MHNLYRVLSELDLSGLHYSLARYRADAVTIHVSIVGKRIEIDIEADGTICTSEFSGSEDVTPGLDNVLKLIEERSE